MLTLRKSEVSIEFISLVGFILVIFIIVLVVVGLKNKDVSEATVFSDAQRIANLVANEINFAASMEGYYREFTLSQKLVNNIDYNVSINTDFRFVEVKWNGKNERGEVVSSGIYIIQMRAGDFIKHQRMLLLR